MSRRRPTPEVGEGAAWVALDLDHPMADLRRLARGVGPDGQPLLSQAGAAALLGLPATGGSISTVSSPELRGPAVQLQRLLARADAYGLDVEVRVRRR